jgi:hypothetical protein
MKPIIRLIIFSILLNSCDPGYLAYVRNFKDIPLVVTLELSNGFSMALSDSLMATNRIIEISANPNQNILDSIINTVKIDEKTVQFKINQKSTVLVGAPNYGLDRVIIQTNNQSDTIIFNGIKRNFKTYLNNGSIQFKKKLFQFAYIIDINY